MNVAMLFLDHQQAVFYRGFIDTGLPSALVARAAMIIVGAFGNFPAHRSNLFYRNVSSYPRALAAKRLFFALLKEIDIAINFARICSVGIASTLSHFRPVGTRKTIP